MRCSVVFGITLRLVVINISSSSPAINAAAYCQRCVITCETVAVHRLPRLQRLPVAALTQAVKPDRDFCLPHLHSTPPLGGFPSEYCYAVWHRKTRMVWLPDGEKILKISLFILTWSTNVTDTHTQTPHDGIRRATALCIASRGKNWSFRKEFNVSSHNLDILQQNNLESTHRVETFAKADHPMHLPVATHATIA